MVVSLCSGVGGWFRPVGEWIVTGYRLLVTVFRVVGGLVLGQPFEYLGVGVGSVPFHGLLGVCVEGFDD